MIDLYSASSNLGDNLSLTPIMRVTTCRVHLIDDPGVRQIAPLFDRLGEVVFDNDKRWATPQTQEGGPHSARFMAAYGLTGNAIPGIKLTDDEVKWGHDFVSSLNAPYVCVIKSSTQQANYRTPPDGLIQRIVDANPDTQFIMSALSSKHVKHNFQYVPLKGVYTMWDYSVRQLAAIYHAVGRYVGPDTGDGHLMLAVKGRADILVPPSRWDYDHSTFHYRTEDFVGERRRAFYHDWTQPFGTSICNLNLPSSI